MAFGFIYQATMPLQWVASHGFHHIYGTSTLCRCFEVNGCPGLQWQGQNTCSEDTVAKVTIGSPMGEKNSNWAFVNDCTSIEQFEPSDIENLLDHAHPTLIVCLVNLASIETIRILKNIF